MGHFVSHPKLVQLVKTAASILKSKKIFLTRRRHIIFLCGGSVKTPQSSARSKFLQYTRTNLTDPTFFLAEHASKDLLLHDNPGFINLSDFESLVAEIADCIILFPETPGAIAELGLFAASKPARKNLLVVNDSKHQSNDSFINLGPLDTIDKVSRFKPRLLLDLSRQRPKFRDVRKRLERLGQFRNQRLFKADTFKQMTKSERLFVVLEIVNIFQVLSFLEIVELVRNIFGKSNLKELRHLLSILIAAKYLKRVGLDEDFFRAAKPPQSFFDFQKFDLDGMKLEILDYYQENDPNRYTVFES